MTKPNGWDALWDWNDPELEYTKFEMAVDAALTTLHDVSGGDMLTKKSSHIYAAVKTVTDLLVDVDELDNVIDGSPYRNEGIIEILNTLPDPGRLMPGHTRNSNEEFQWDMIPKDAQAFLHISFGVKIFQDKYDPKSPQSLNFSKYHDIVKFALFSAQESGLETFFVGGVGLNAKYAQHLLDYWAKSEDPNRN